jgi:exodeoxyribonuclease-5
MRIALKDALRKEFPHIPTKDQSECMDMLSDFCVKPVDYKTFILKGYAGTGKTSVISALIRAVKKLGHSCILLAPTGRAAKVLSGYSQHSAFSIHKIIYRQKNGYDPIFNLNYNKYKNTLFIIDEASMIANMESGTAQFGSGRLLDDLIEFIYSGENCQAIFIGDTAQLLPLGQPYSPALNKTVLEGYGLEADEYELTEVLRQSADSGILYNATILRRSITNEDVKPKLNLHFPDIKKVSGEALIDTINTSYNEVGSEYTVVLTYSNKRSVLYNKGIRNQVLMKEDEISNGDFLLVTKNNYFWNKPYENLDFIANGDIAEITRIRKQTEMYGFRFADVTLRLLDYDMEIDARILLDSLYADNQQSVNNLNNRLLESIAEDYAEETSKKRFWDEMRKNEYFNALQVKFAYSITCHKAQGGQWKHVFVDQGYLQEDMINTEYYQWLYTAFTRAEEKLFLVNFSDFMFETN